MLKNLNDRWCLKHLKFFRLYQHVTHIGKDRNRNQKQGYHICSKYFIEKKKRRKSNAIIATSIAVILK